MTGLPTWIGLVNLPAHQCTGQDCDGKVEWYDGSTFLHATWMGDAFPDFSTGSACIWLNSDLSFTQGACTGELQATCEYDCSGFSEKISVKLMWKMLSLCLL